MGIVDRHLFSLLGLVALTALAIAWPRAADDAGAAATLHRVPPTVDGWTASASAPESMLPADSRARDAGRWTYSQGNRDVFVTIARYRPSADPAWRPSINQIVPTSGAISVKHDGVAMNLGTPGASTPLSIVSVKNPDSSLSVVYWYQIRDKTFAEEFRLRLALLLNAVRFRSQEVWLVRIAAPSAERPEEFLRGFYPKLVKMLSQ